MAIMAGVVGVLSPLMHDGLDVFDSFEWEISAIKLIAKMHIIAAFAYKTSMGLPIVYPRKDLTL